MSMFIDFLVAAVMSGTPLLFGTLGEIVNEKSGHLNLGVEGMMAIGSCAGFMAGYFCDNLVLAILAAFAAGALTGLIYAILTVTFMADQNVTGLTLTIFGIGLSNFIGKFMLGRSESGTLKLPEEMTEQMRNVDIPVLSDLPVVGELLFSYNPFVYLGIAVAIILAIYLNKTKRGLNLSAIGENPAAAAASGIPVTRYKFFHLLLGGGICGIGGLYCILYVSGNGVWIVDSVGGLGWIAVALVIFATWSPSKALLGSLVFGALRQLKFYKFFPFMSAIPLALYDMLPFLVTALVLVLTSIRQLKDKAQPTSCGVNYFMEDR